MEPVRSNNIPLGRGPLSFSPENHSPPTHTDRPKRREGRRGKKARTLTLTDGEGTEERACSCIELDSLDRSVQENTLQKLLHLRILFLKLFIHMPSTTPYTGVSHKY
jgi:hypothetical protein